jgi:hypothetical protein
LLNVPDDLVDQLDRRRIVETTVQHPVPHGGQPVLAALLTQEAGQKERFALPS